MEKKVTKEVDSNYPYLSPTKDINEIPVCALTLYYGESVSEVINVEKLRELRTCGFNVYLKGALGYNMIAQSLNNAVSAKIKLFINNGTFLAYDSPISSDFLSSDALGGYMLDDEPTYYQIIEKEPVNPDPDTFQPPVTLKGKFDLLMEKDPNHMVLINLVGGPEEYYMKGTTMYGNSYTTESYKEYLNAFNNNIKPGVFEYDLYPVREQLSLLIPDLSPKDNGSFVVSYDRFFIDFELFSQISKKTQRCFWAFCEGINTCVATYKNGDFGIGNYIPLALEQYLRFEAFSALAYGAQGIVYWTYGMRPNQYVEGTNPSNQVYFTALLDRHNKKTPAWYYAQKINQEIQKYKEVFLECTFVAAVHTGKQYELTTPFSANSPFGPVINVESDNGNGILMSSLNKNGKKYLVVVNKDVLNFQTVNFKVNTKNISELTPLNSYSNGGAGNVIINTNLIFSRIFPPGGYRIFQYV